MVRRVGAPLVPSTAMLRRLLASSTIRLAAGLFVAGSLVAACGATQAPPATFDPASACTTDGHRAGAYPDLEASLPASYEGKPATTTDSGRSCTAAALGTLASHGVTGVRFAGATWALGESRALTVAVFDGTGIDAPAMLEFYAVPARSASHTEKLQTSDMTAGGRPAQRLDVLNSDGTGQTIVTWPAAVPGRVHVLLASDLGDTNLAAALEAFAAAP